MCSITFFVLGEISYAASILANLIRIFLMKKIWCNRCLYRRDWAYLPCDKDTAYATINHKEFFAEISVAFFARDYEQLQVVSGSKNEDVVMHMEDLSPPFNSPEVLERQNNKNDEESSANKNRSSKEIFSEMMTYLGRLINRHHIPHCNKFFPFTRKQLECYDYETYRKVLKIWAFVSDWKDPERKEFYCSLWLSCFCSGKEEKKEEIREPLLDEGNVVLSKEEYTKSYIEYNMEDIQEDTVAL